MTKGYWIARVDGPNERDFKPYTEADKAIFKKFGGRYVVRGGKFDAWKAARGRATSLSNLLITPPRSPAIVRRNIRKISSAGRPIRRSIGLYSKAKTARRYKSRASSGANHAQGLLDSADRREQP